MLESSSVDLVVTSPPYPMIEMWDSCFAQMNPETELALAKLDGRSAFGLMHAELDRVWAEVARVLKDGGFACINIGDATRKVGEVFKLYNNHSRISSKLFDLGLDPLPVILWRKQTNAPNKFMGSGMLPSGAYVTLEHEYILIFRKSGKRLFAGGEEKRNRRASAFFWEERNIWFSDIWDFKGIRQALNSSEPRARSGAFPYELSDRLISMYSVYGDTVLDPFLGTGTTMLSAAAAMRNSVGFEYDQEFETLINGRLRMAPAYSADRAWKRLNDHLEFISDYSQRKGKPAHTNACYGFPVVTSQETELELFEVTDVNTTAENGYGIDYSRAELKGERPVLEEKPTGGTQGGTQLSLEWT